MLPYASLFRPELSDLRAYEPVAGAFAVRLDANEAPPLLSTEARRKIADALAEPPLERYPDARAAALRSAVARRYGASSAQVLTATGSDEIIALLLTALARPRPGASDAAIVTVAPTFVMYRHTAMTHGFRVVAAPLDADWDIDVAAMTAAIDQSAPNIVFVASPNNPTAAQLSIERIEAIAHAAPDALVVLDEAYVDYAAADQRSLRRLPNVAVMGTLSKVGLAALRIGWLVGPDELVRELDKVRQPFNISAPTMQAATLALTELEPDIARVRAAVVAERTRLAAALTARGLRPGRSDANFLWVDTNRVAADLAQALAARGVLVRCFASADPRMARHLRITVGLPTDNDRLLEEIGRCG